MYKRCQVYSFILICLIVLFLPACDQTRVKGVRERNKLKAEPEIRVVLRSGQERAMKLEEYITGVVAGEMKPDWPENAYAAQAIIARTFALKYMEENQTNTISGSYQFAQEYKPQNITPELREAVKKTRGEVALYQDDYISAWFHSSAAGQTTSAKVGLAYEREEPPYIVSVKSPDNQAPEDVQNWAAEFTSSEIIEALSNLGENIANLNNIEVVSRDDTGRVIDLKFISDNTVVVNAAQFRNQLDSKKLKSTKISEIKRTNDKYSFTGSGFGHGVGMSQWGAYALAKEGKSPEEIINYYFKDIEIVKEYD